MEKLLPIFDMKVKQNIQKKNRNMFKVFYLSW